MKLALSFLAGLALARWWRRAEERYDQQAITGRWRDWINRPGRKDDRLFLGIDPGIVGGDRTWPDYATRRMAYERETGFGLDE